MISNRNLSILLLITGFVGISFGGLIMRNINTADPWQIAFYRALAFLFPITLILFHQHRLGIVTNIKKIGYPGMTGGFFLMLAQLLFIQRVCKYLSCKCIVYPKFDPLYYSDSSIHIFKRENIFKNNYYNVFCIYGNIYYD